MPDHRALLEHLQRLDMPIDDWERGVLVRELLDPVANFADFVMGLTFALDLVQVGNLHAALSWAFSENNVARLPLPSRKHDEPPLNLSTPSACLPK